MLPVSANATEGDVDVSHDSLWMPAKVTLAVLEKDLVCDPVELPESVIVPDGLSL
jgi:hypothetical protein